VMVMVVVEHGSWAGKPARGGSMRASKKHEGAVQMVKSPHGHAHRPCLYLPHFDLATDRNARRTVPQRI
jgi:hypothetical protein